ncbi:bacteriocin immunity protein [Pseudomonas protegens]|uniref:bacteriocin immunity protein n=1 Tax=Pseudomonas protegens TaxID=380021 RepID=UPI000F4BDAF7|nr:bacteriocin immunity protein [Pseudomonas protegens]
MLTLLWSSTAPEPSVHSGLLYYPKPEKNGPEAIVKEVNEWQATNSKPGFKKHAHHQKPSHRGKSVTGFSSDLCTNALIALYWDARSKRISWRIAVPASMLRRDTT